MPDATISPLIKPRLWDVCFLRTIPSPGVCQIVGFERKHNWQVTAPTGIVGGTMWYRNRPPAEGSIKVSLASTADFKAWDEWVDGIEPKVVRSQTAQPTSAPIEIYHPSLAVLRITAIVVRGIKPIVMAQPGMPGQYLGEIACIEYLPPYKATAKADGPIPHVDVSKRQPPTAQTERTRRLNEAAARGSEAIRRLGT